MDIGRWVVLSRVGWGWANLFFRNGRPLTFGTRRQAESWAAAEHPGEEFRVVTVRELIHGEGP